MSDGNEPTPWAPPASRLTEPPPDPTGLGASRGQRFANLVVDQVVLTFVSTIRGVLQPNASFGQAILETTAVSLAYHALLEGLFGRTIGKLVTGTRVVSEDGGPASWAQILGRSLARFIPFEPLSFFGAPPPVGWHDSLSGTRVIRVR